MTEIQRYSAKQLIEDVAELLRERGLNPERDLDLRWERSIGASKLLRGFGITDTVEPKDAIDLDGHLGYVRRVHGD